MAEPLGGYSFVAEQKGDVPPVIVVKAYDFALWMLPKVEKFPRSYRFSVGDRLIASTLDVLLMLVEAAYSSEKTKPEAGSSVFLNHVPAIPNS